MEIFNVDKLILFFLFFIPGFISIKLYSLIVSTEKNDFSKAILEVVSYSALNYAFFSPLFYLIFKYSFDKSHEILFSIFLFIVILIAPIGWTFLFRWLPSTKVYSKYFLDPNKSAWDYKFSQKQGCWVTVHLKDGRKLGGKFGKNSFASSFPRKKELYIEDYGL